MRKLIAIDGNSLMHRAFYALPPMTTAGGVPTGALHGFLSMLLKLTAMEPEYLLVAFDVHGPTFRHEFYDAYKAGRRETPDDLKKQFPILKELLTEMGVAVCECPRYEADDILGTFARRCKTAGISALLVTGDRDALQLVDDFTHVLMTKKGISDTTEFDPATLKEAYGLAPDEMRDLKALMGDSSDNIPGIPGVGEKTALKLLDEFGSLEDVLLNADQIGGKLGERIRSNLNLARLSYRLGTIDTQAPVTMEIEDCRFRPESMAAARPHLLQLELRALASRLPEDNIQAVPAVAADSLPEMIALDSAESLVAAMAGHARAREIAIELSEGFSFAFSPELCYTASGSADLFHPAIEDSQLWRALSPLLEDEAVTLLAFDAKRLHHAAAQYGVKIRCRIFDAMICDYLQNAIRPAGTLRALCQKHFSQERSDAAALFLLREPMLSELKNAGMLTLYTDMELPLSKVLYEMEQVGFMIDDSILAQLQGQLGARAAELADTIYGLAGKQFNILSPKQLGEVLFQELGLQGQRKTKTGYSTDADTLEALADEHPIVSHVLEYRFVAKLKSTFVDGLLSVRSKDGRVRSQFNQCVTATGRISSTEPNLQNIPVRTPLGREIRKAFVASPGNLLVGADYSQIELRILAHMSGDENMIAAFQSDADFHRITASEVFGVPLEAVSGELRSAAKAVNFGIVYGISDFGLARNLGIPVKQAADYIRLYFARYPGIKAYLDESVETAKACGYAVTLFGRRRSLPELNSGNYNTRSFGERVAMNMPIQGTAADIIKLVMVRASQALAERRLQARLILQIHDELIFDTPVKELDAVCLLARECMEDVVRLRAPLVADIKSGRSWYDTK